MRSTVAALIFALVAAACGDSSSGGSHDGPGDRNIQSDSPTSDIRADVGPGQDAGPKLDGPHDAALPVDAPPPDAVWHGPGCVQGTFQPYRGVLHSHTGYSDGTGTPAEAFPYARDTAQLDFLAVTDHNEQLPIPYPTIAKWVLCWQAANAANADGAFVAVCGLEYGSGYIFTPGPESTGHNNVFFTPDPFPMLQADFHDFYHSLAACATCIGQYNHPGSDTEANWNNFEYDAAADQKMNLFEFNGTDKAWELFFQALDRGWTVSPTNNQDNHSADWGMKNDARSGLFMSALTRDGMKDAMLNRRSFQTLDQDATIKLMADGVCWMGSILSGYSSLSVSIEATDPGSADGFDTIELYGPGQTLILSHPCGGGQSCSMSHTLNVTAATYVVARANQSDGDYLVAAPVWVSP